MPSSSSNVDKKNNSGDDFEVLDVRDSAAEGADSFLRFIQKYISEGSNPKQLAIGGVSGWYLMIICFFNILCKTLLHCFTHLFYTGYQDILP